VVTKGEAGAGVEELADELVASDLESWDPVTLDAGSGSRR
jgi:hypothetical protein